MLEINIYIFWFFSLKFVVMYAHFFLYNCLKQSRYCIGFETLSLSFFATSLHVTNLLIKITIQNLCFLHNSFFLLFFVALQKSGPFEQKKNLRTELATDVIYTPHIKASLMVRHHFFLPCSTSLQSKTRICTLYTYIMHHVYT